MAKAKKSLGLIGFGSFSQFITPHLKPYFDIRATNRSDKSEEARALGVDYVSLRETAEADIVVLSVPVQFLKEVILSIKDYVRPGALIIDVSSVKVKPLSMMGEFLPESTEIIGTHPLFGPQSGKRGIEGLNLVLCDYRTKQLRKVAKFFENELKLNVLLRTPQVHDRQMAYVQALTHFIGRAVNEMDIPDVEQKTSAYQHLLEIKRNLGQDSFDLFVTIENENPYAADVRKQYLDELKKLESRLSQKSPE